ncbi:MAG: hypothetical protein LBL04_04030 [Bacteroidales bacterium]|jgi:hypothetical protein|nr:hypothetical protein [Bacteroidales bacterium]
MKKTVNLSFAVISLMVFFAAMSRLLPHPPNFAPIGGMALFGAAYYSKRYWAFLIPIVSMWISDLVLNNVVYARYFDGFVWFYSGSLFTCGAFVLIALLGLWTLRKVRIPALLLSTVAASALFFAVSNFGVWWSAGMYPHTASGLWACYVAGLPFFRNTLGGDLVYTALLFGVFEWSVRRFPALRPHPVPASDYLKAVR